MALVALGSLLYLFMYFYFARANKARAAGQSDKRIEGLNENEILELGDENPRFMFSK